MRRSLILLLPALLALASCGTASQYASSQTYPDGIYYRPEPVVELYSEDDFKAMAAEQIASRAAAADSLKTARKGNTDYYNSYIYSYDPYYYSSWYHPYYSSWYSPYWGYRSWYGMSPYWYSGWYGGFYDYWYDPYWGYASYYGPSWYYGGYYRPYRPHGFIGSGSYGRHTSNGQTYRRSGSSTSASSAPGKNNRYDPEGSRSSSRSVYRRSGSSYSSGSDSGSSRSSSSSSSYRSGSYSSSSSHSSSGHSSGGYSGGGHSSGGYSGGGSHSGGSSGGGRR